MLRRTWLGEKDMRKRKEWFVLGKKLKEVRRDSLENHGVGNR